MTILWRNKLYKNNDLRFLFKSLDKNEQSKKWKKGSNDDRIRNKCDKELQ